MDSCSIIDNKGAMCVFLGKNYTYNLDIFQNVAEYICWSNIFLRKRLIIKEPQMSPELCGLGFHPLEEKYACTYYYHNNNVCVHICVRIEKLH